MIQLDPLLLGRLEASLDAIRDYFFPLSCVINHKLRIFLKVDFRLSCNPFLNGKIRLNSIRRILRTRHQSGLGEQRGVFRQ